MTCDLARSTLVGMLLLCSSMAVHAQAYKCKTPDGRTEISDSPCRAGSKTEAVQAAEHITPEQRQQAEQDLERAKKYIAEREVAEREAEAASQARRAAAAQVAPPPPASPATPPSQEIYVGGVDPYTRCVRDVELLNLAPQRRLEMLDSCRSGSAYRSRTQTLAPAPVIVVTPVVPVPPTAPATTPKGSAMALPGTDTRSLGGATKPCAGYPREPGCSR